MKRVPKLILSSVALGAVVTCLWCLLCPILFPQRMKAANDSYQKWIADHPTPKK
jgi:hypothetical protein